MRGLLVGFVAVVISFHEPISRGLSATMHEPVLRCAMSAKDIAVPDGSIDVDRSFGRTQGGDGWRWDRRYLVCVENNFGARIKDGRRCRQIGRRLREFDPEGVPFNPHVNPHFHVVGWRLPEILDVDRHFGRSGLHLFDGGVINADICPELAFGGVLHSLEGAAGDGGLKLSGVSGFLGSTRGQSGVFHPLAHVAQLPDKETSLNGGCEEQKAGNERQNPSRQYEAPFVRRFLTAFLFLPFGFGCALFGGHYLYRQRYGLGAALIGGGWLLFCMGGVVVVLSYWPSTWGWWI
ncbi:hypothetical protein ACVIHI_003045 [Bradyrhizobium sp. USDA 4524]